MWLEGVKLQLQQTSAGDTYMWVYFCLLQIHPHMSFGYHLDVFVAAKGVR